MSAKFPTFAYNSRTVRSSCMKFSQQFKIIEFPVCTKIRGNKSRDFGFRTRKPLQKFGVKSSLIQRRLKYTKQYFTRLYILRYPFIPTNPLLAAMRSISFFSSSILYALLLNHKISKSNFCVKLLSCKRNFEYRNFFGSLPREPPPPKKMGPKNQFFEQLHLVYQFFLISADI